MIPGRVKIMVLAHVCISLAGVLVHGKIHPPADSLYFWWAAPVSLFSVMVVSVLYCSPATVGWGFLLNAGTVLIGTIGMLYHFVLTVESPLTLYNAVLDSALPGILIAWIKIPLSLVILHAMRPLRRVQQERGCLEGLE